MACILAFAGGAAGGGGGGGIRAVEEVEFWLRVWLGRVVVAAAAGVGTGRGVCSEAGPRFVVDEAAAGRVLWARAGLPLGPPGLMSLPRVIGLGGTGLPFGVGFDVELGGSPCWVCTALLL